MTPRRTSIQLLDALIGHWCLWSENGDYYVNVLAPSIARGDGSQPLSDIDEAIVAELRRQLSAQEWQRLPALIVERRAHRLTELASDRDRARVDAESEQRAAEERAQREAEEEKERQAAEQERLRQETERRLATQRAQQEAEKLAARRRAVALWLNGIFESDFLNADPQFADHADSQLFTEDDFHGLKARFVQQWAARELKETLDIEQAAAVAAVRGDIQVVARAGSGKTRTLVTRAIFLQRHCKVSPRELLLLAFNSKAAAEMRGRLAKKLGEDLPHVMTFHALAYALVHPEEKLLVDDASADQLGLSRGIQDVIDEHIRSEEYRGYIRDLMLAHFRDDWEHIVDGRFHLSMDEFLAHRRALPRESLNGDYIKSFGEKVIANALFEHAVEYRYERNFRWSGVNYRPDFTIPTGRKGGIIIEYFGLRGDPDYDKMSAAKRRFWSEQDEWAFLEFSPADLSGRGVDGFTQLILERLRGLGTACERRSEEEIWEIVRARALDRFSSAMQSLVSRCRKRDLAPRDLDQMICGHASCSEAEELFLQVGASVYRGYLERLALTSSEDFDGLMWRSIKLLRDGNSRFARDRGREQGDVTHLRYVMIDEFQDFSEMFYQLVDAVRARNGRVQFFCVGDDWQAINAFAGSDLGFFKDFPRYFHNTSRRYVRTNYRSPVSIVDVGNALMSGKGESATAKRSDRGRVLLCRLDQFSPTAPEQARHNGDEITPAVLRLARSFLDRGLDVVMLSRRNAVPWYVNKSRARGRTVNALELFGEHIRSFLPEDDRGRVAVSTAHKFKGLERSAVIILDAVIQSYPLIHPNWVFLRVFGDTVDRIEEEERRLFYVALTRAQDSLAIVTDEATESPYLDDIRRGSSLTLVSWNDLPPVASLDGARLDIRVSNSFAVKDHLKNLNYAYNGAGKCWQKSVPAEGFSWEALRGQPWAVGGVTIEVFSETGDLLHRV